MSKIFTTDGRMNRAKYFKVMLLISGVLFIFAALLVAGKEAGRGTEFVPIIIIFRLAYIFPVVQRWHDLNKSGWLVFLNLIPCIGVVFDLILLFVNGTIGPNRFGPDPLEKVSIHQSDSAHIKQGYENLMQAGNIASSHLSSADEIAKLADLRDKGIVTEEEFQHKKKQILGL